MPNYIPSKLRESIVHSKNSNTLLRVTLSLMLLVFLVACNEASPKPKPDTTPPNTPNGLSITAGNATVNLQWSTNSEEDFLSYILYKGTISGGLNQFKQFPKDTLSYTDTEVSNATKYFYSLSALDTSDNESPKTSEVSITPKGPDPTAEVCRFNNSSSTFNNCLFKP